jgi:hypothetical protein
MLACALQSGCVACVGRTAAAATAAVLRVTVALLLGYYLGATVTQYSSSSSSAAAQQAVHQQPYNMGVVCCRALIRMHRIVCGNQRHRSESCASSRDVATSVAATCCGSSAFDVRLCCTTAPRCSNADGCATATAAIDAAVVASAAAASCPIAQGMPAWRRPNQ